MRGSAPTSRYGRSDAANELYDSACELLYAAQRLDSAVSAPGSAPALAAVAGCVDASIEALISAMRSMRDSALVELERTARGERGVAVAEADAEFAAFVDALRVAHRRCDSMRQRLGPLLAEMTLCQP